jgi:hypothetical protein
LLHETKLKAKSRRASGKLAAGVDEAAAASVADEVPQEDDIKKQKRVDQLVPV